MKTLGSLKLRVLPTQIQWIQESRTQHLLIPQAENIALVDGMVLVQKLSKKPATVVSVTDLGGCFNDRLMSLIQD